MGSSLRIWPNASRLSVPPHFDLHIQLSVAVEHSLFVKYIPLLGLVLSSTLSLSVSISPSPDRPGHGIAFDQEKLSQFYLT